MGIIIEASVSCDLSTNGQHCYNCMEVDTAMVKYDDSLECYTEERARKAGWIFLGESARWACPKCVELFGGEEAIRKKDFEGTL